MLELKINVAGVHNGPHLRELVGGHGVSWKKGKSQVSSCLRPIEEHQNKFEFTAYKGIGKYFVGKQDNNKYSDLSLV